jgi:cobalt-zinc-cadmium efflux system protein
VKLFFQASPEANHTKAIHEELIHKNESAGIHHEHCWSLDGEHHVYTAHLQLHLPVSVQEQIHLKKVIAGKLARFNLTHTTIELEFPEEGCRDTQ